MIRIPSISVTSRRTLDVPPIPGTRTGSYSFHSERFRKSYGIFRNRYETFQHGYLNEAGPSALKALPFYLLCERLDLWVFIKDMRVDWIDHSLSFTDWLAPYLEVARQ